MILACVVMRFIPIVGLLAIGFVAAVKTHVHAMFLTSTAIDKTGFGMMPASVDHPSFAHIVNGDALLIRFLRDGQRRKRRFDVILSVFGQLRTIGFFVNHVARTFHRQAAFVSAARE